MSTKGLSLALVCLLINLACIVSVRAATRAEKEARFAEKVKAGIAKLGTGPEARVKVKLRDKTKLDGYISETGEDFFVVVNAKTGIATTVAYPQVKQVKGNNLSAGVQIAILAGLIVFLSCSASSHQERSPAMVNADGWKKAYVLYHLP